MAGNSKGPKKIKARTSSHGVVGFEAIDGLSDLPDNVLHHVLSFLDTGAMVRTSLLSRRWRYLWKDVPALNFKSFYFRNKLNIREHIGKLLSLRSDSAVVSSITFNMYYIGVGQKLDIDLFDSVMKYAASHATGEHCLHELSITDGLACSSFSEVAASITAHRHHQSLKTVELKRFFFQSAGALGSVFNCVTTLKLSECRFESFAARGVTCDPFADLPQLQYLKLVCCTRSSRLKVSGLQLLNLEIQASLDSRDKIEVIAPKLKSFCFWGSILMFSKLCVPSLDCANIRVAWQIRQKQKHPLKRENFACMRLLRALHNVTSLNLRFQRLWGLEHWEQHEFPLNSMKSLMEGKASPFTRLRTLRVQYPQEPPNTPYQVLRYFFDGSPDTEEKSFKIEMKIY